MVQWWASGPCLPLLSKAGQVQCVSYLLASHETLIVCGCLLYGPRTIIPCGPFVVLLRVNVKRTAIRIYNKLYMVLRPIYETFVLLA
ncbi:hypothetical protein F5B21DRAFT_451214 [Xylaria acuta]|nr:hypothetical protein F5B21DRAFT_451214 [Xylaria acuta]